MQSQKIYKNSADVFGFRLAAKLFKGTVMRFNGNAQRFLVVIWNVMFVGHRSYDRTYLRVMYAAHFRKQVMLDLVVESPDIPAKQFVIVGKVGGSFQLVNHPGVFNIAFFIFRRVFSTLNYVSKLKDNT